MFITKEKYEEMNSEIKRLSQILHTKDCDLDYYRTLNHRLDEVLSESNNGKDELTEQVRKLKEENAVLSALLKLSTEGK